MFSFTLTVEYISRLVKNDMPIYLTCVVISLLLMTFIKTQIVAIAIVFAHRVACASLVVSYVLWQ